MSRTRHFRICSCRRNLFPRLGRCWRRAEGVPKMRRQFGVAHSSGGRRRNSERSSNFETDRARFIGRGRDATSPVSILSGQPLSGTVGSVLDPAMSLRRSVRIPPGGTTRIVFAMAAASSREQALNLADKYSGVGMIKRTLAMAWTQAQVQLYHLGISADEANLFPEVGKSFVVFRSRGAAVFRAIDAHEPANQRAVENTASRVICPSSWFGLMARKR